jgi:hypothetical protein
MLEFIEKYSEVWGSDPKSLLDEYNYQPELTKKLDNLKVEDFGREVLYEIVLWKLSRFPHVEENLFEELKGVAKLKPKEHEKARDLIGKLLRSPGIALPMASTILRFLNPSAFQIIDDRAYRVLLPGNTKYPTKPVKMSERYVKTSIDIYFEYLDELHRIASEALPFESADRILYKLDILLGNGIGEKPS